MIERSVGHEETGGNGVEFEEGEIFGVIEKPFFGQRENVIVRRKAELGAQGSVEQAQDEGFPREAVGKQTNGFRHQVARVDAYSNPRRRPDKH